MPITFDRNDAGSLIRLEGDINISSAAELKRLLLEALGSSSGLLLELERVTDLDITAMQLLWAAAHEASTLGKECTLSGQLPAGVSAAVRDAGFEQFPFLPKPM